MKQTILLTFSAISIFLIFLSFNDGPYPENTGAPGEMTCFRSGCHIGSASGNNDVFISLNDSLFFYQQGTTYSLSLGFLNNTVESGFQIVALDDNYNNIGTWNTNSLPIYKVISGFSFPNRKYLEHTLQGTTQNQWTVDWTAPTNYNSDITFYASFLSTNNDNDNIGDTLYTKIFVIGHDPLMNSPQDRLKENYKITARNKEILINYRSDEMLSLAIYNISGRLIYSERVGSGSTSYTVENSGLYLVKLMNEENVTTGVEKVMVY